MHAQDALMKQNIHLRRNLRLVITRGTTALKIGAILVAITFFFSNIFTDLLLKAQTSAIGWTTLLGWNFQRLELTGTKYLTDAQILQALGLKSEESILVLDLPSAHKRIQALTWVEKSLLRRKLPNTIRVEIIEKEPIALLRQNAGIYLLARDSSIIQGANVSDLKHLLSVAGEGAQENTAKLLQQLQAHKALASKVMAAVRCQNRRWDLYLDGKILVKMPEEDFERAWDYLHKLHTKANLFEANYSVIDLRDHEKCYITHSKPQQSQSR